MMNRICLHLYKITTIISLLLWTASSAALEPVKSYDLPINYNQRYVKDPHALIVKSLKSREWEIKDSQPGKITGWLNNYKDHEIVLAIHYNDSQISFEPISAKKLNCSKKRRKKCRFLDKHYTKWRLYLRKSIALNIHTLAIEELLNQKPIRDSWLKVLESGSIDEKTKLARNIIDLELFNPYALEVITREIENLSTVKKITASLVQQYAFYCKVLARTKDPKYIPLLKEVVATVPSRKIRNYVKDYLKANYNISAPKKTSRKRF